MRRGCGKRCYPVAILYRWGALQVSDAALAGALGVDVRALDRWRNGMHPQRSVRERLAALARLHERLLESFDDADDLRVWLHADNRYLGGLKPVEALSAGRLDRVEAALEALDSGFFV